MICRPYLILMFFVILSNSSHAQGDESFDMQHLWLDLHADNLSTQISGSAHLTVAIKEANLTTIKLELTDQLTVTSVKVGGTPTTFTHEGEALKVTINSPAIDQLITVTVTYLGAPNAAGNADGIYNNFSNAWGNQITWTLSEPFYAKYWWPAKQDLNDKLDSVRIHITTSDHLKVGSNGLLTNTVSLNNNKVRYEWVSRYPIAYYLVAFTVGEYVEYNNFAKPDALNGDSILVQNYIYNNPETLRHYQNQLDEIPEMLELFSTYFGLYPFHKEKYGHVMAPFSGGMEHQTMSTMGVFTFGLNAHELGHQWFGDHITCATWSDIWINEGFARFCEYFAAEKILSAKNGKALVNDDILTVTGTADGSVYVPHNMAKDDSRIFNYRLTYAKGGLVVNMIRQVINNDDLFFKAVRNYLFEYGGSTASAQHFKAVIEKESGKDFTAFFDQWYYGEGHPVFDITWHKATGDTLEIKINQQTTASVNLFTTPLAFKITFESGQIKLFMLAQSTNEQTFKVSASGKVKKLEFDPDGWLIKEVNSFYQVDENGTPILSTDQKPSILIYPNPGKGQVYFTQPLSNIEVFNASGKRVLTYINTTSSLPIDQLPTGIYLLRGQAAHSPVSTRLVVN